MRKEKYIRPEININEFSSENIMDLPSGVTEPVTTSPNPVAVNSIFRLGGGKETALHSFGGSYFGDDLP